MSNTPLQAPRGTYDALPEKAARLRHIEQTAMEVFSHYGYGEIRTPIFEFTDVFARNVGDSTDIVNKEMYTFPDRNNESLTLRPEGTAGVVRAYYSNKMKHQLPLKVAYIGAPMFRYERPQKGRYRQFHQIGLEFFGASSPWADVEVIAAGIAMLEALGIHNATVRLNSLGTPEDRQSYRAKLHAYFDAVRDQLSEDSQSRLDKNPLRILDSKEEQDKTFVADAPLPIDHLGDDAEQHFNAVKQGLDALGIPYEIEPTLVRGLDYYTHTVFEIHGESLGAQSQVIGGGRYDGLIEQMGGEKVAGVGFGCGLERLEMMLETMPGAKRPVAFVAQNKQALVQSLQLANVLRSEGIPAIAPLELTSMKSQFKKADKAHARYTVIIGEGELEKGIVMLKDMETSDQRELPAQTFLDTLCALVREQ